MMGEVHEGCGQRSALPVSRSFVLEGGDGRSERAMGGELWETVRGDELDAGLCDTGMEGRLDVELGEVYVDRPLDMELPEMDMESALDMEVRETDDASAC